MKKINFRKCWPSIIGLFLLFFIILSIFIGLDIVCYNNAQFDFLEEEFTFIGVTIKYKYLLVYFGLYYAFVSINFLVKCLIAFFYNNIVKNMRKDD